MTPFQMKVGLGLVALLSLGSAIAYSPSTNRIKLEGYPAPYLLIFAADKDETESDFLAVMDVDPQSAKQGQPLHTLPTGMRNSMPHHMEFDLPPEGQPLFMNAHRPEKTLLVNLDTPLDLTIEKVLSQPTSLRFAHDYARTHSGSVMVGFLAGDAEGGNGSGGIAEYSAQGEFQRSASAAVEGLAKPVRPYAFAMLPEIDRFVLTSAPMMQKSWAEVIQLYRYSDLSLLKTLPMPAPKGAQVKPEWPALATAMGAEVLEDGSVFLSSYECSLYHLTGLESDTPRVTLVHSIHSAPGKKPAQGCGVPVRAGRLWFQPVGRENEMVVLDIADPEKPSEVFRLETPAGFKPHWLSKDPGSNRLILGSEMGREEGFFMLRYDPDSGALEYDKQFRGKMPGGLPGQKASGYVSLERNDWPHGDTGPAWGHAALFLPIRD